MSGRRIKKDFLIKNGLDRRFIKSYVLALINGRNPETPLLSFAKSHDYISALVNDKSLYIKNKRRKLKSLNNSDNEVALLKKIRKEI